MVQKVLWVLFDAGWHLQHAKFNPLNSQATPPPPKSCTSRFSLPITIPL